MTRGPLYSAEEVDLVLRLRAFGWAYEQISARTGRSIASLKGTVHRVRHGKHGLGKRERIYREADQMAEALVAAGTTKLKDIAAATGVSVTNTSRRMMRLGLDAEMRRELAETGDMRI